jgi:large subunit ribosomal protein L22
MPYKYSLKTNEHMAKAVGILLPISAKQSIEICSKLKGKDLQDAKKMLEDVIGMKKPFKFTRFTEGAGHKHGIGPGKYPVKSSKEILKLLKLVESNAQQKALDTSNLVIIHMCAKKGPNTWHYGRQIRVSMKRTNVEVVVEEKELKKKTRQNKEKKQPEKKVEKKKEQKEQEKKQAGTKEKPVKEDKSQSKKEKVPSAKELAEKEKNKENNLNSPNKENKQADKK